MMKSMKFSRYNKMDDDELIAQMERLDVAEIMAEEAALGGFRIDADFECDAPKFYDFAVELQPTADASTPERWFSN